MDHIGRLWRGEVELGSAFWNWAVLGGLLVNVASTLCFLFLIMTDRPIVALAVGYGLSVPYNVLATVGVWRSADRYAGERRWAEAAKAATVVGMALLSVT